MSEINPGIRGMVRWLRGKGFDTIDSGDGETHDFGCDRPYPYVVMLSAAPAIDADYLYQLLLDDGIEVVPVNPEGSGPHIQATYDPANRRGTVELVGVTEPPE